MFNPDTADNAKPQAVLKQPANLNFNLYDPNGIDETKPDQFKLFPLSPEQADDLTKTVYGKAMLGLLALKMKILQDKAKKQMEVKEPYFVIGLGQVGLKDLWLEVPLSEHNFRFNNTHEINASLTVKDIQRITDTYENDLVHSGVLEYGLLDENERQKTINPDISLQTYRNAFYTHPAITDNYNPQEIGDMLYRLSHETTQDSRLVRTFECANSNGAFFVAQKRKTLRNLGFSADDEKEILGKVNGLQIKAVISYLAEKKLLPLLSPKNMNDENTKQLAKQALVGFMQDFPDYVDSKVDNVVAQAQSQLKENGTFNDAQLQELGVGALLDDLHDPEPTQEQTYVQQRENEISSAIQQNQQPSLMQAGENNNTPATNAQEQDEHQEQRYSTPYDRTPFDLPTPTPFQQ